MEPIRAIDQHRQNKLYNIGEVLAILKPEFPDLTPSKLRFLEDQGLVTPQRTEAGYRKFSDAQVERVKVALELQRDQYLPLKVIRQYFEDLDGGKNPALPINAPTANKLRKSLKFSTMKLIEESGISNPALKEAQEVGLIGQEPHSSQELEIAMSIAGLSQFGIAPRHLKGLKASADREIGIIGGVIEPVVKKRTPESSAKAAYYAREIENRFANIRSQLLDGEISKLDK